MRRCRIHVESTEFRVQSTGYRSNMVAASIIDTLDATWVATALCLFVGAFFLFYCFKKLRDRGNGLYSYFHRAQL